MGVNCNLHEVFDCFDEPFLREICVVKYFRVPVPVDPHVQAVYRTYAC